MSVGFPVNKDIIDSLAGSLCVQLRDNFASIKRFAEFLGNAKQDDTALVSYGYTSEEVATLRSAFMVLDQFRQVWEGTQAIPAPVNISGYIIPFVSTS